jgi:muramoyltetrapeptide carboxypeptidase
VSSLLAGKTFGLVAPAGPVRDSDVLERALARAGQLGWKFKEFGIRDSWGYLSSNDVNRCAALRSAFEDPEVDLVWCVRGGYGSGRILELCEFESLYSNKKPFLGFSDITALHCGFLCSGAVSDAQRLFHAPMLLSLLGREVIDGGSLESFEQIVSGSSCRLNLNGQILRSGCARGRILGGNLAVLMSLVGTGYLPSFDGAILILEDVGELPYRIDRLLLQAQKSGMLSRLSAAVLGQFSSLDETPASEPGSMQYVLREYFDPLNIPVIMNVPIGHERCNLTVPLGVEGSLEVGTERALLSWHGTDSK